MIKQKIKGVISKLKAYTGYNRLVAWSKTTNFLRLGGISLYDIINGFFNGVKNSNLTMRSAAISYSFFLALFPFIIFLFTFIAFLPINNLQDQILEGLSDLLPDYTYITVRETIIDIISIQRGSLLSFGFLTAFYFSSNGIRAIIAAFTVFSTKKYKRPEWRIQLLSAGLTISLVVLLVLAIVVVVATSFGLSYLKEMGIVKDSFTLALIAIGKWLVFFSLLWLSVSILYRFGPPKYARFRLFSPGALVASVLMVISIILFSFYVSNFATYNKVYGSIGTIIVVLLLININALLLLVGYEFNVSFYSKLPEKSN
jgi:membrane protein